MVFPLNHHFYDQISGSPMVSWSPWHDVVSSFRVAGSFGRDICLPTVRLRFAEGACCLVQKCWCVSICCIWLLVLVFVSSASWCWCWCWCWWCCFRCRCRCRCATSSCWSRVKAQHHSVQRRNAAVHEVSNQH